MRSVRLVLVALALVALFVASSLPLSNLGAATAPVAPLAGPAAARATVAPASPHPAITCPPPPYPIYSMENGVWPLSPSQRFQGACGYINPDEVHAGFFSSQPGSGGRFTIPMTLPRDGAQSQSNAYLESWVGMVVTGDLFSEWKQSYAGIFFVPSGSGPSLTYSASFHIFSLVNALEFPSGVCPSTNLTWNSSFECEIDDFAPTNANNTTMSYPAGDHLTVTFAGNHSSSAGLMVWVNDTTTPADSLTYLLTATNTGTYTFKPAFNAACPDVCLLNWSMNVGLGMGFTMCPNAPAAFSQCDSYNSTIWEGSHPPEYGIPHFFAGGSYSGDYYYFAPVSDSGVCNFVIGLTGNCYNNAIGGGTGFYPWFTYNGSELDFGTNWSWTTQPWGGASLELLSTASLHDLIPFYFYRTTNDSREGFVDRGRALNVTAWVQDLGSITSVSLTYEVNNGAPTTIPMSFVNGIASSANYTAEIPAGPDGWVNYTLTAINHAGASVAQPFTGAYHVQRGPLPTFRVTVGIAYPACATTLINGVPYTNNTTASLLPGDYSLQGHACYPYVFQRWAATRGVAASAPNSVVTTLGLSATGTLDAVWAYARPQDTIVAHTNPGNCGQVVLNGTDLNDGDPASPPLQDQKNYSLSYLGCAGKSFAGWSFTGNLSILGGRGGIWTLEPLSNGTVTAIFVNTSSANPVIFYTNPSSCGGIKLRGAGYVDGTSLNLAAGTYPIAPDPCFHYGFRPPWVTTGGLSVAGDNLTVTGSGTITENYYVLTIVEVVISGCGFSYWDSQRVYEFQNLSVTNNSTHVVTATACPGWYLFAISGAYGVNVVGNVATVNASGVVYYTFIRGSPNQIVAFLTDPTGCGAIIFNGAPFYNSNFTVVAPGTVATVTPAPCVGYGFLQWVTYGGITILGGTAWLNNSGAIQAIFEPLATLYVYTSPSGCGSVSIANTSYTNGATLTVTEFKSYPVVPLPCAGYGFSNWVNSSGAQLPLGTSVGAQGLFLSSAAVLTAVYAPVLYRVTVAVTPANCGGVRLNGQSVGNGTVLSLAGGTYTISPQPCTGNHLVRWTPTQNLSVTNTTLWVNGSGTVAALYQPVPPSIAITVPSSAFSGFSVLFGVVVAVPVPPYNYSYSWQFGDGGTTVTPVNFTSHSFASTGSYRVSVVVTDPYGRLANASGTIQVIAPTGTSVSGLSTTAISALAVAIVVVAAVSVVGLLQRRRGGRPPSDEGPDVAPPPEPTPSALSESASSAPEMEPSKP